VPGLARRSSLVMRQAAFRCALILASISPTGPHPARLRRDITALRGPALSCGSMVFSESYAALSPSGVARQLFRWAMEIR